VHTFTDLALKKKGNQTVTVADTMFGALTTTVSIAVR
jgi:hypothetical protein